MFSCRDATNLMTDAGEGALEGGARLRFRVHMFVCAHCRAYRRQLVATMELLKTIRDTRDSLPDDAEERLVEAFRARKS